MDKNWTTWNTQAMQALDRGDIEQAEREEVPLGCNLGKAVTISPIVFLLSHRVLRDCHVASLLAMTHQAGARVHQSPYMVEYPVYGAR